MIIDAQGLAKTFRVGLLSRKVEAVRDATFQVAENDVFGFVGPNGAGKSTTLHMLLGLVRPSGGRATIWGHPLGHRAVLRRLGYLPELPNFYGYLKAGELLRMGGQLAGVDGPTLRRRVPELLERVGLAGREQQPMRTFSKGMLQRAGLAQALVGDPDLVVLDEPMSGLDPLGRHVVRGVILDLKASGKTVLFSSHVLPDVEALCNRVALIAAGRTLRIATVAELLASGKASYAVQFRDAREPLPDALRGLGTLTQASDVSTLVVDEEQQLAPLLEWIHHHAKLTALNPLRESLEEVVVRELAPQNQQVQP